MWDTALTFIKDNLTTGIFATLFIFLIQRVLTSESREFSLKKQITSLDKKLADETTEKSKFKSENDELKKQTSEEPLEYNKELSCYLDKEKHKYCPFCYDDSDKIKRIKLSPQDDSAARWDCGVCGKSIENPHWRPPQNPPRAKGPTGYGW